MTAVSDVASGVVRAVVELAASPERVFAALTEPKQLEMWWGSDEMYRTFDWQTDLRPGGIRNCQARSPKGDLSWVRGEYLVVDPPRVLEFTWNASWDQGPMTRVRMEVAPVGSGSRLTVIHSGFGEDAKRSGNYADGWNRVLGWLKPYMERAAK